MFIFFRNKLYFLLRWSEKYTKTDMVYLAKGGSWLSLSKMVGMGTSLVLAIAFANLLPKEEYGAYKYILSIAALFSIATLPGINTALTRSIALGYEGSIRQAIKIKSLWGLLGVLTGIMIAGYYFFNSNAYLGFGFLAAAIFAPLIDSTILYGPYLQGKKLFKLSALFNTVSQVTLTIIIVITLLLSKNVPLIILASYATTFVVQGTLFLYTLKRFPFNTKEDATTIAFGKHLSIMNVLGLAANQFDKILMWHMLGPVQLAIYAFSITPVTQLKTFLRSLTPLALPKLAQQDKKVLRRTLLPKIGKLILILLIPIALYIICVPYLYALLFPQYLDSVPYTRWYVFIILLYPLSLIDTTFVAHAQNKNLYIIKTATPLMRVALLLFMLPLYGIAGAIAAMIISSLLNSVISLYLFRKTAATTQ